MIPNLLIAAALLLGQQVKKDPGQPPVEELFVTEEVYPQEKGEVEVVLGSMFHKDGSQKTKHIPLAVEYGIGGSWQVEAQWDGYTNLTPFIGPSAHSVGNLTVGVKRSFMNMRNSDIHSAVGFTVGAPFGSVNQGFNDGLMEYLPNVILARDLPQWKNIHVITQAGIDFVQRIKSPSNQTPVPAAHKFEWNSGFLVPYDRLRFVVEYNWLTNTWNHGGQDNQKYVTPGIVWDLPSVWEFSVGSAIGVNHGAEKFRVMARVIYQFTIAK